MHSFEVRSNENACRKSGRLGQEQVFKGRAYRDIFINKGSQLIGQKLHVQCESLKVVWFGTSSN